MNEKFDELTRSLARPVTRRTAIKRVGLSFAGMALARFGLNEAKAITNGQLDGDAHPNVACFVWLQSLWPPVPAPVFGGSGILIHPRVVLTAGHGTNLIQSAIAQGLMTLDDLLLSFASDATDPATWRTISAVVTHPDFDSKGPVVDGAGDIPLADVGVAILTEPAIGLPLTPLPPLGFLDDLDATGPLRHGSDRADFTVVGYGTVLGDPVGQVPFPPDGLRRFAQSEFLNLHDRWLFLNQNAVQGNGGGGTGDSGGPVFWVDPMTGTTTLVATTSRGDLRNRALGVAYRVDTLEAIGFLNDVIARVEAGDM